MDPTPTPEATSQPAANDGKNTRGQNISRAALYGVQTILLWLAGLIIWMLLASLPAAMREWLGLFFLVLWFIISLLLVIGFGRGLKSVSNTPEALRKSWNVTILMAVVIAGVCVLGYGHNRRSSQDKAVHGNARQLSAAFDQYMLENGVSTAALSDLVGPDKYVKAVHTVAGETYPAYFTQYIPITITGVAGARTVTYAP